MKFIDFTFIDAERSREIPVRVYIPENAETSSVVIFGHGYQDQEDLAKQDVKFSCKNYE